MLPSKKSKHSLLQDQFKEPRNIDWNWLYLKSHLVFSFIVFFGMLAFIWWITR